MKRTLFNLEKQAVQTKKYSTVPLINKSNTITDLLNILSKETQGKIILTFYKCTLEEVQNNIQMGRELMTNRANRDPLGSLEAFKKAVEIADTFLKNYPLDSLSPPSKSILGQAYAGYASVLYKCTIKEIDIIKENVKKALKLDPENEIAKELSFDMRFYDLVPEPPRNKI